MQSDIQYVKSDKIYHTSKSPWHPRKARIWLIVPLLLTLVLGGYCLMMGIGSKTTGMTEYEVTGDINYKVYLKENDYYTEKFLGEGMQYIASLISVIRADFSYELEMQSGTVSGYEYEIVAEAKATDRNNQTKVLYEKTETLKSGQVKTMDVEKVAINDSVDIDYGKYNDYLRSFRNDFGVAANCQLDLKMLVKVNGTIETQDVLAMSIPLSEQTVDITLDTQGIVRKDKVGTERLEIYVQNLPLLITGAVIVLISIVLLIMVIYCYATRYNDDLYEKALHKILKEYDSYIVEGSETIYELDNVVRVASFKELLDAQNLENTPIVFLEVMPGEKAYFVVNGVNTTYRYTLSRAYQNYLKAQGESEF